MSLLLSSSFAGVAVTYVFHGVFIESARRNLALRDPRVMGVFCGQCDPDYEVWEVAFSDYRVSE